MGSDVEARRPDGCDTAEGHEPRAGVGGGAACQLGGGQLSEPTGGDAEVLQPGGRSVRQDDEAPAEGQPRPASGAESSVSVGGDTVGGPAVAEAAALEAAAGALEAASMRAACCTESSDLPGDPVSEGNETPADLWRRRLLPVYSGSGCSSCMLGIGSFLARLPIGCWRWG